MPATPDMAGILLELSRIAEETGIQFESITPGEAVVEGTFQKVPISLAFDGNFYELSDFLFRLRTLVSVRSGELRASGRLFAVETISFEESPSGFPEIAAGLTVAAYVYGTEVSAGAAPLDHDRGTGPERSRLRQPADRGTDRSGGKPLMAKRIDPLKAKQAKQKKLAIGLGVALVAVGAFQGPKTLKMLKGPQPVASATSTTPAATPAASPTPARDALHSDARGSASCAGGDPAGRRTRRLRSSAGGIGSQLLSFEQFQTKDPFAQQVEAAGSSDEAASGSTEEGPAPAEPAPTRRTARTSIPAPASTRSDRTRRTRIRTPTAQLHAPGSGSPGTEPARRTRRSPRRRPRSPSTARSSPSRPRHRSPPTEPVFQLVSLSRDGKSVRIGVAGGSYASGEPTVKLELGKTLTLQNTADGSRYELKLLTVQGFARPSARSRSLAPAVSEAAAERSCSWNTSALARGRRAALMAAQAVRARVRPPAPNPLVFLGTRRR